MSLLKRIEQGQGGESQGPPEGEGESRLTSIRTRRMPPPGVLAPKGDIFRLKDPRPEPAACGTGSLDGCIPGWGCAPGNPGPF